MCPRSRPSHSGHLGACVVVEAAGGGASGVFCEELFSGREAHVEDTRNTVSETMDRIQVDLTALQRGLAHLHATAPLVGPVPQHLRAARRSWHMTAQRAQEALMLSRQSLAMLSLCRSSPDALAPGSPSAESSVVRRGERPAPEPGSPASPA